MRIAGEITAKARHEAGRALTRGVTTADIDAIVYDTIKGCGATPSFLGYAGFPASACISINHEVIHGIPSKHRVVRNGDIVSIDVGAVYEGYNGDCAATFCVGEVSPDAKRLIEVTQQSFFEGIKFARAGNRIGDISSAIQHYVESHGYSIVREYVGHGIGREMHESPEVPNYGAEGRGIRLIPGMTLAIEPMVNMKGAGVRVLSDNWTVVTQDHSLSAHYENTIAITNGDPIILTRYSEESIV